MKSSRLTVASPDDGSLDTELLTIEEACDKLRISRWQFYRLVHRRQLASIHIGRRHLIPAKAVVTFIKERSEEAA